MLMATCFNIHGISGMVRRRQHCLIPQHTYSANGPYTAVLTIDDGRGGTSTTNVSITAGNRRPVATISAPLSTLRFKVGDVIAFSGSATDPDSGPLPASALSWQVNLYHCDAGVCHVHPF